MVKQGEKSDLFKLVDWLKKSRLQIATAESCTGGLVAKYLTDMAGSSTWFERGFITYTNQSKIDLLGVLPQTVARHGAVSRQVVTEMAQGALNRSRADVALAISGIAGPDGGDQDKPVGTVWFAWMSEHFQSQAMQQFSGERHDIRKAAAWYAMKICRDLLVKQAQNSGI